ncbi:hypothetical protein VNO77_33131 [Canavalia gladiata]|uniref:Uncharacterized protein n=1 Tax=Canavalia gladiata TaxID=3824 RepID=A0AAN9KF12_CANGL
MEIVDFIPVCGGMKKCRRRESYHKLKRRIEVSDYNYENVGISSSKAHMVEVIPKVQPKIRLSRNLWKRLRNAYVQGMLCLAEHVAHFNNGEICFLKKIHDDDDELQLLI